MLLILRTIAEFFLLGCLGLASARAFRSHKGYTPSLPLHLGLFAAVAGGVFNIDLLAAAGWICMIAGSATMLFFPRDRAVASLSGGWKGAAVVVAVSAAFVVATLSMNHLKMDSLPPALQSAWFAPHVASYMIGYALVSIGSVLFIKGNEDTARKLVRLGFAFLTAGMSMGALWAQNAWGCFWSWDPKETAAAAFGTAYAVFLHLGSRVGRRWGIVILVIAFILLNLCWWGLNLMGCTSLHAAGGHV